MPSPRKSAASPTGADPHPDPVALNAILTVEGVALSSYALMLALERENGRALPLAKLSARAGHNYWAVRNQLRRTPYFDIHRAAGTRHIHVSLTEEAREKLTRIRQRIGKLP